MLRGGLGGSPRSPVCSAWCRSSYQCSEITRRCCEWDGVSVPVGLLAWFWNARHCLDAICKKRAAPALLGIHGYTQYWQPVVDHASFKSCL